MSSQPLNPWAQLFQRAMEDPDFRESLIADPRTTITDAIGATFPDDVEIVVVEDTPNRMHIVLPSTDINLDDLNAAGGVDMTCMTICKGPQDAVPPCVL